MLMLGDMKKNSDYLSSLHFFLSCMLFLSKSGQGKQAHSYQYDASATTKCVAEPGNTPYEGGIIFNPEFSHGTTGWTVFGEGSIEVHKSLTNNSFIVAYGRKDSMDGLSQRVYLEKGNHYSFSAWIQISEGTEVVSVVFRFMEGKFVRGGSVIAKHGCWSLLKGGIFANSSVPADVLFESMNNSINVWVDNVSMQPFSKKQWRSHQDKSIDKVRKSKVMFQVTDANKTKLQGARVLIKQIQSAFPFGCGMNFHILESADYRKWFATRFRYTTFTNAMKWYSTEEKQGQENYTIADAMVKFSKENDIRIRGHNIFWDDPKYQPEWVKTLCPEELKAAAEKRINSVVTRYAGQLIAWDVVNENLHFSFFEDKLGENASSMYFSKAYSLDPCARMFMNEYNTIEDSNDVTASAVNYLRRLEGILAYPGNQELLAGIGVQGHFGPGQPNLAYMRSSLDILATAGIPIWITEADVSKGPNQAEYLEEVLREGYSHPAVGGIIMFAGPKTAGFNSTTLVNKNFNNTPAGSVVDKLIEEWKSSPMELRTDSGGGCETTLYLGEYEITVIHPFSTSSVVIRCEVTKDLDGKAIHLQI